MTSIANNIGLTMHMQNIINLQLAKGLCKKLCLDTLVEKVGMEGGEVGDQVLNILRNSYIAMMDQVYNLINLN